MTNPKVALRPWQKKLHEIIYEADTPVGKLFDILLIVFIFLSVAVVMLESVKEINNRFGWLLLTMEWFITFIFSMEYILRLLCIKKKLKYAFSFFGVIDLIAILPSYLEFFMHTQSASYLATIRILRVLRIFRILKLTQYLVEANVLITALRQSRRKVLIFLSTVVVLVIILGSFMFLIENEVNPAYSSIPRSIYWAIVTITTVGYGDISPITIPGQCLASVVMILGYAILAVPTGIVSVELNEAYRKIRETTSTLACLSCSAEGHDHDAEYCKFCGEEL